MIPAALAASLEPLANAKVAEVAHSPPRTGRAHPARGAAQPARGPHRSTRKPTAKPSTGEMVRAEEEPERPPPASTPSSPPQ